MSLYQSAKLNLHASYWLTMPLSWIRKLTNLVSEFGLGSHLHISPILVKNITIELPRVISHQHSHKENKPMCTMSIINEVDHSNPLIHLHRTLKVNTSQFLLHHFLLASLHLNLRSFESKNEHHTTPTISHILLMTVVDVESKVFKVWRDFLL